MAIIQTSVPDAWLSRLVDAFAWKYVYDLNKLEGETKGAFAKRMHSRNAKNLLVEYEAFLASTAAITTSNQETSAVDIN
jgi:hypothetical protein